ncbi:C69 family dipeptidase [Nioella aestuarii]|uniref:C69 family dipeptidase n=1 Tax=Nioella aestuarii TaxID=1662864 RepID=UPI003D7F7E47
MSYAIYVGKNHTKDGHGWLAGYGDEPSSHWLEVVAGADHAPDSTIEVGVGPEADMPGHRIHIPQAPRTAAHIRVSYSYYLGVPAPITNGGLNEYGLAVRDVWSTSRAELIAMTPADQTGPNYSDLARIALERTRTAREAVEVCAGLIAEHGESTYGGNSHLFADENEAWVMIQFAGGQGLWVAERLGPDSIRASRPGYVLDVPVEEPDHPDFLYSANFVDVARDLGWYSGGAFNANAIYGDGKGRWGGVEWIEGEMARRAAERGIGFEDMIWAIRTERLTGDTAGYGQVVALRDPGHAGLRSLWHAPAGAVAAPFAPVFLGQGVVPAEFGPHRYLTTGESHRFMDMRKVLAGGDDVLSLVPQSGEASRSAVAECKRLLYLMGLVGPACLARIHGAFARREMRLAGLSSRMEKAARVLLDQGEAIAAQAVLSQFSASELREGLQMVMALADGLEAELTAGGPLPQAPEPKGFDQLW